MHGSITIPGTTDKPTLVDIAINVVQSLLTSLKPQTMCLGLLLPSLGDGCFSDSMRLYTNFKGSLTIQCSNHLGETTNDVVKGVHFVVVQYYPPHFFLVLVWIRLGLDSVHDLDSLFGCADLFSIRHVQLALIESVAGSGGCDPASTARRGLSSRNADGSSLGGGQRCHEGKRH